jgi:hypothetical protein
LFENVEVATIIDKLEGEMWDYNTTNPPAEACVYRFSVRVLTWKEFIKLHITADA